jgi:hypothetical protein
MTILEKMRARSAKVAATTVIETPKPLKAVGDAKEAEVKWWGPWVAYLHAVERHPDQRNDYAQQFTRQTGLALS